MSDTTAYVISNIFHNTVNDECIPLVSFEVSFLISKIIFQLLCFVTNVCINFRYLELINSKRILIFNLQSTN